MAWRAWHGIAWRGMGWYMVWPGGMACIWYGLAGIAWYMVWPMAWRDMALYMKSPGGHGIMVYGMAWRGMAWYIVWLGGHGMVYDKTWRGVRKLLYEFHGLGIVLGCGPVHMWRSRCQLEVLFIGTGPVHKYRERYMHVPFTCTAPVHSGQWQ